jgi:hypothetical protein
MTGLRKGSSDLPELSPRICPSKVSIESALDLFHISESCSSPGKIALLLLSLLFKVLHAGFVSRVTCA